MEIALHLLGDIWNHNFHGDDTWPVATQKIPYFARYPAYSSTGGKGERNMLHELTSWFSEKWNHWQLMPHWQNPEQTWKRLSCVCVRGCKTAGRVGSCGGHQHTDEWLFTWTGHKMDEQWNGRWERVMPISFTGWWGTPQGQRPVRNNASFAAICKWRTAEGDGFPLERTKISLHHFFSVWWSTFITQNLTQTSQKEPMLLILCWENAKVARFYLESQKSFLLLWDQWPPHSAINSNN